MDELNKEKESMVLAQAPSEELLSATDAQIVAAMDHADPMVLRGLLYQLTGDEDVARTAVKFVQAGIGENMVLADPADEAWLRERAVEYLKRYRATGEQINDPALDGRLAKSLSLTAGERLNEDDLAYWIEDLALDPWARSFSWQEPVDPERVEAFKVAVIGAGIGGLAAALQLKRAGIPFTVLEKNAGVGGTWFENHYPGARLDTPARSYRHSFGVEFPHVNAFSDWQENQSYFDWVADHYELRSEITFNTEVTSMEWRETDSHWLIEAESPDGHLTLVANAVITAVGFLNRPKLPDIDGMADFEGPSWHTARWPSDYEIAGKRIAVIGTGCTGYQLIPEVARDAAHVTVFQRTPQWLVDVPGYSEPFQAEVTWLDRNFPLYRNFARFRATHAVMAFTRIREIDPTFEDAEEVSAATKAAREHCLEFLNRKLGDPELVAKMTPAHPVLSARPVIVDPEYSVLDALLRENVTLVTDGISRITEDGVQAVDGTEHKVDAIVYATGFHATQYLFPMSIRGREGRTPQMLWQVGGARSYNFSMIPGFPNLWMVYGPNTNGCLNVAGFHELVIRYALQCIEHLIRSGQAVIEPTESAYWRHSQEVDRRNASKTWSDPRSHGYHYSHADHRSPVMCPFFGPEVWHRLRRPALDDLETRQGHPRPVAGL